MADDTDSNHSNDDGSLSDAECGLCQSRCRTTFSRRFTSALNPAEFMDMEVYCASAKLSLSMALCLVNVAALLVSLHHRMSVVLSYWEVISTAASSIGDSLRQAMKKIKSQVGFILFGISWIKSYGEISLLYAEDLEVFRRPRLQRFYEEKNRKIADISSADSDTWFRLKPNQLRQMFIY